MNRTLSLLCYINFGSDKRTCVSKEPKVSMSAWDENYIGSMQNLEGIDLGEWMVYLFCDDTALYS